MTRAKFQTNYVIDDHPLIREAMGRLLRQIDPLKQCEEVESPQKFFTIASCGLPPNLIMLDLVMGNENGLDWIERIKSDYPESKLIVLSSSCPIEFRQKCIELGADDFFEKTQPTIQLRKGLMSHLGVDEKMTDEPRLELTTRQKQIIFLLAKGAGNKEIGAQAEITELTVKAHLSHIYKRIGVKNRAEAMRWAIENGHA